MNRSVLDVVSGVFRPEKGQAMGSGLDSIQRDSTEYAASVVLRNSGRKCRYADQSSHPVTVPERSPLVSSYSPTLFMLVFLTISAGVRAQTINFPEELERFRGDWQVVELIEDGRVIPQNEIKTALPSGGKLTIVSNTIQMTAPIVGAMAKVFSVDPTSYPKGIAIANLDKPEGWGIYEFDGERLVVCLSDPAVAQRPTGFSSRPGSRHMLMVLRRTDRVDAAAATAVQTPALPSPPTTATAQTPPTSPSVTTVSTPNPAPVPVVSEPTTRTLTDGQVKPMVLGTWRFKDGVGMLQLCLDSNGTYRMFREVQDTNANTYYKVFVPTQVSAGTWTVENGKLIFRVTQNTDPSRVNQTQHAVVRSISGKELVFVDSYGNTGTAVKVR
jgi:uncharacterized protein (TIGR03067 family)